MSHKNPNDNNPAVVLDLTSRRGGREAVGAIVKSCRECAIEKLDERLTVMFERADDTLFDLGERAGSNMFQTRYFDSMRELRRQRKTSVRTFHEELRRAFKDFSSNNTEAAQRPSGGASTHTPHEGLSLVDDEEYEETLAINNMVGKAQTRYRYALHPLSKRFSVLRGGMEMEFGAGPVGPARICEAFSIASESFELEIQARIVVYKLFDRFVMEHLEELYASLNQILVEAGVLPHFKTTFKRPTSEGGMGTQPVDAGQSTGDDPLSSQQATDASMLPAGASEEDRMLTVIENMLAIRHGGHGGHGGARVQAGSARTPMSVAQRSAAVSNASASGAGASLWAALEALQSRVAGAPYEGQAAEQVQLRQLLASTAAGPHQANVQPDVSNQEQDTIDLVAMLFEFIVQDKNLPDPIQATLTRLQIPYLKIALRNRRFFAQRSHPARRLLDAMARAGIGWTQRDDRSAMLLNQLRSIVERVLAEFEDDVDLFDTLLEEFDEFMEKYQKVSRVAEKRTTEAAQGRERLQHARTRAAQEITRRLKQPDLPTVVRYLLGQPWSNVLLLTLLRKGARSEEWTQALMVADDLIWAVQPKVDAAARSRLREMILPLLDAIADGLELVAIHNEELERIQGELIEAFEQALNAESAPQVPKALQGEEKDVELPDWVVELGDTPVVVQKPAESKDKESPDQRLQIALGAWFEFTGEEGEVQRGKLSWISPISRRYLFVDQKGLKVADKAPDELSAGLREGTIRVLDDEALMDRALVSIEKKLREEVPEKASQEST